MSSLAEFPLSVGRLQSLVRDAASDSSNVYFSRHAQQRMLERDVTAPDIIECLLRGAFEEGPYRSAKGNWEFTVRQFCSGVSLTVAGALELDEYGNHIVVITTYRG